MSKPAIYKLGKGLVDWTAYRGGIRSFCNKDWVVSLEDFLTKNRESSGLIIKNVREDVNKPEIRLALWHKQNGIDPSTGKKIPFSDVLNTNRNSGYEVDHKDPLDKGGFNEFSNLQLISGTLNAQKSSKSNYQFQIEEN
jgi:CRISPR/Cas system Type II protein with McrA/HNH and RuvC-like nuclease domain